MLEGEAGTLPASSVVAEPEAVPLPDGSTMPLTPEPRHASGEATAAAALGVLEVLVHEGDRHAALADRGGDALDRAEAHVAAREDARDARLEQVRVAVELPVRRAATSAP